MGFNSGFKGLMNKILKHGWILSMYCIYLNAKQGYSLKFGA